MLEMIQQVRIDKRNETSWKLYDIFQHRYCLGVTGVVGAIAIASLSIRNIKPLSLMLVAPSGQMKSQITRDLCLMFPKNTYMITSRFTPYGLSHKVGQANLDGRTWVVNDMVRTFDGLSQVKISETVGWLAEMMSEGHAGSATAQEAELTARMNIMGNLALISYVDLQRKFVTSTLNERILQFGYFVDKCLVREKSDRDYGNNPHPFQIELKDSMLALPRKEKKKIYSYADKLGIIAHYEKQSMRPDEIIMAFLAGHAKLNGRHELNKSDYKFLDMIFRHFRKLI